MAGSVDGVSSTSKGHGTEAITNQIQAAYGSGEEKNKAEEIGAIIGSPTVMAASTVAGPWGPLVAGFLSAALKLGGKLSG